MTENDEKLENFERAFSGRINGCLLTCDCGKEYFDNHNEGYTWEPGKLEALLSNKEAVALDYAPGDICFEGKTYVNGCSCWHERAFKIMGFIDSHANAIADYLTREKKRKQRIADAAPVVEGES